MGSEARTSPAAVASSELATLAALVMPPSRDREESWEPLDPQPRRPARAGRAGLVLPSQAQVEEARLEARPPEARPQEDEARSHPAAPAVVPWVAGPEAVQASV